METYEGKSHPDCINSSNPFHECVDYCFRKIEEAKERIRRALDESKDDASVPGERIVHPDCIKESPSPVLFGNGRGVNDIRESHIAPFRVRRKYKTKKSDKFKSPDSPASDCAEVTEYDLARKLLAFEKLGYLTKSYRDTDDDESLSQYGDKFGLPIINDFPKFFKLVPQHPHYGETSLDHVNEANAENYWDLFMPLIHRGIVAVQNDNKKEIAAVERRITHFTSQGFDLRHLQAYINTYRNVREDHSSLISALEKVTSGIQTEKKRIDNIISGKSLAGEIEDLEAEKARYQKFIADIELSLVSKRKLLEEENAIRSTSTSPMYETLLRTKSDLDKRIIETRDKAKELMIEDVIKALSKEQVCGS